MSRIGMDIGMVVKNWRCRRLS